MGNNYTIEYLKLQKKQQAMMTGFKAVNNKIFSGLKEKLKSVWEKMVQSVEMMEDKSYEKNQEKIIKVGEKRDNFQDKSNKIDLDLNQLKKNRQFYQDMLKISATDSQQYKDWYKRLKKIEKRIDEKENKKEKAENSFEKNVDKWENLYRKINKYKNARGLGKVVVPLSVQEENNPFKIFVEDTLKKQAQQAEKLNQQNEQPKPAQEKQEPEQLKPAQEKQKPEQLKPVQEKQEMEHYTQEEKIEIHKLLFEMQIKRIAELETENELLKKDANNQREALNKEREKKQRETKKEIESLITTKKNLTVEIENEKKEKEKLKKQLNYAKDLIDKFVYQNEELIKEIEQNNQNLNQNEGQQR